jgi:hypothetical protein
MITRYSWTYDSFSILITYLSIAALVIIAALVMDCIRSKIGG